MAVTLIVNPGSTSRKYALYRDDVCIASVAVEETATGVESCVTELNGVATCETWPTDSLPGALERVIAWATTKGLLAVPVELDRIGVRVVAPGTFFTEHRLIDEAFVTALTEAAYLVPVHIPIVLREIASIRTLFPKTPCFALSDSAFHTTALAYTMTNSLGDEAIRGFGYHGLSLASVARKLAQSWGTLPKRTIVLHVGGGVSVTALRDGASMATSMGFTPASGVLMGSRGGDVSADAMIAYMRSHDLTPVDALAHLYKDAGFHGLVGVSDPRLVLERAAAHDERAKGALAAYLFGIQSKIAAYTVLLGGVDAVVLTATAVVRNPHLRELLLANLTLLGIQVDGERNEVLIGKEGRIEAEDSVPIIVMKTDEMGEMAATLTRLQVRRKTRARP